MKKFRLKAEFWVTSVVIFLSSTLLVFLDHSDNRFRGWIAYIILFALGAGVFYWISKLVSANRQARMAALVSFFLRLGVGVAIALLLPIIGYQNSPEHQAGYVYTD